MKVVNSAKFILLILLLVVGFSRSWSQLNSHRPQNHLAIFAKDDADPKDTVWLVIGEDSAATKGIDAILGEYEAPPMPPTGWDIRLLPPNFKSGDTSLGVGAYTDLIPYPAVGAKDTFLIQFQNTDFPNATYTFYWNMAEVVQEADSQNLKIPAYFDSDGNLIVPARTIRMGQVDSAVVDQSPYVYNVTTVKIIKFNPNRIMGVQPVKGQIPTMFALHHNYPNPFNPSTTLRFDLPRQAMTEIAVFNILGQKVTTLVSQELPAKSYTTEWNGTSASGAPVGSGVYFVRMTARGSDGQQFTALQKVMLMK